MDDIQKAQWRKLRASFNWTSFDCLVCQEKTYIDYRVNNTKEVVSLDLITGVSSKKKIITPAVKLHCTCGWTGVITVEEYESRGGSMVSLLAINKVVQTVKPIKDIDVEM